MRNDDTLLARTGARSSLASFRNVPPPVAEELIQEATLATVLAADVRDPDKYAWCVARRLAIDWLRRRRETGPVDEPPDGSCFQDRVHARMELDRVYRAVEKAPPTHRATLLELVLAEATVEEAMDRWGADRDAVYKRRRRALRWLRTTLDRARPHPTAR